MGRWTNGGPAASSTSKPSGIVNSWVGNLICAAKASGANSEIAPATRKARGFMAWFIVRNGRAGQHENRAGPGSHIVSKMCGQRRLYGARLCEPQQRVRFEPSEFIAWAR